MSKITLDRLPLEDAETGDLTVVVETPRGSRNKLVYDPVCDVIRLGAVLAEGLVFPYDFGFFPSTLGEDGDPLDVLLLLDAPVPTGCVVTSRLIGVVEVEQKETGQGWQRNDRFIAVATHAHTHSELTGLPDLRPRFLAEIDAFLIHYAGMNGKTLRILRHGGPKQAQRRLRGGVRAFRRRG